MFWAGEENNLFLVYSVLKLFGWGRLFSCPPNTFGTTKIYEDGPKA